jgi:tetratricopeptide (TPR) repeat protein
MNIGSVYYSLEHYDVAVEHYNQSLKIQLKALPPEHPEIGKSYEGIRLVHECKNELQQALTYY